LVIHLKGIAFGAVPVTVSLILFRLGLVIHLESIAFGAVLVMVILFIAVIGVATQVHLGLLAIQRRRCTAESPVQEIGECGHLNYLSL